MKSIDRIVEQFIVFMVFLFLILDKTLLKTELYVMKMFTFFILVSAFFLLTFLKTYQDMSETITPPYYQRR